MKKTMVIAAATLALSAGVAFAGEDRSGYLYPNDGSPAGEAPNAVVVPEAPTPGIGGLPFTHTYLFSPSDINDDSNGAS